MNKDNKPTIEEMAAYFSLANEKPPFADVGYEPKTKMWGRFSVEDVVFNPNRNDIEKVYEMCFKRHKDDRIEGTELSMVLNWKIWQWYEKNNDLAKLYDELWRDCGSYCDDNFSKDELEYFYKIID